MAAKINQPASNLPPLQSALLGARHCADNISEAGIVAYWLDGRADTSRDQHIGWLIDAYDQLAPHIDVLRAQIAHREAA